MFKELFIILFIFALGTMHFTHPVFAHLLQTDGTIGALMHIDPNDDPIAGQQTSFFFDFKDTTNTFDPKNCTCKLTILEHGHTIYAQPLFQNTSSSNIYSASVFYTLPQPDIYHIVLSGKPLAGNAFHSFTLTYTIRAEQPSSQTTTQSSNFFLTHLGHFIAGICLLFLVIAVAVYNYIDHKSIFSKP